jgi:hypothetical protein
LANPDWRFCKIVKLLYGGGFSQTFIAEDGFA